MDIPPFHNQEEKPECFYSRILRSVVHVGMDTYEKWML